MRLISSEKTPNVRLKSRCAMHFAITFSVSAILSFSSLSRAQEQEFQNFASSDESEFFTIQENQISQLDASFKQPFTLLSESLEDLASNVDRVLSLLSWRRHDGARQEPTQKYNRLTHFGTWVNDPNDGICQNTRAEVLKRDSLSPVTMKPGSRCTVATGEWEDPYTGRTFTQAKEVHIDHVVPLKNAYISGAWKWANRKRCLYANFTSNSYHLISVSGRENMSKGDDTPADYIPPNETITCQYVENWLKIKLTWGLSMGAEEGAAVREIIKDSGCKLSDVTMSRRELQKLRKAISNNVAACF